VCGRLGYGALAPPVGLGGADSSPFAALSLEAGFSAAAPPDGVASLAGVALEAGSLLSPAALSPLAEVASLGALVVLVEVLVVEVFCAVAASALVFVGGVTSGVLLGTASDTVVPPHPLSASPHSSAAHAASARRAFTAAPYACRTSGSR
jgi:hypothetical protein